MAVFRRPTATTTAAEAAGFLAFPNPTTEILTLCQPGRTAASGRPLDAWGREAVRQPAAGPEVLIPVAAGWYRGFRRRSGSMPTGAS